MSACVSYFGDGAVSVSCSSFLAIAWEVVLGTDKFAGDRYIFYRYGARIRKKSRFTS